MPVVNGLGQRRHSCRVFYRASLLLHAKQAARHYNKLTENWPAIVIQFNLTFTSKSVPCG